MTIILSLTLIGAPPATHSSTARLMRGATHISDAEIRDAAAARAGYQAASRAGGAAPNSRRRQTAHGRRVSAAEQPLELER